MVLISRLSGLIIAAIAYTAHRTLSGVNAAPVDLATTSTIDLNSTQYPYGPYAVSIINTFNDDTFTDEIDGYYYIHKTFQVDFAVQNSNNSVKEVGIRYWNDTSSNTYYEAAAHFNQTIGNGYQLWTLFFDRGLIRNDDWAAIFAEYEIAAYISYA
ncbi:hypothetical protein HDU76_006189, partial [Blyttiomyces sp. JEL0837]